MLNLILPIWVKEWVLTISNRSINIYFHQEYGHILKHKTNKFQMTFYSGSLYCSARASGLSSSHSSLISPSCPNNGLSRLCRLNYAPNAWLQCQQQYSWKPRGALQWILWQSWLWHSGMIGYFLPLVDHRFIIAKGIGNWMNWYAKIHLKVFLRSTICSIQVLSEMNSNPQEAISDVACFFEYNMIGVLLAKWTHPVTDFPDSTLCIRLASK